MAIPIGYNDVKSTSGPKASIGWHYAMTHNWDLVIDVGVLPPPLDDLAKAFGGKDGFINAACTQINNLPNSNLNEGILSSNIRGIPFHQPAGRESSVREINLSMYEFWDYRLLRFFETWKNMAVNRFDGSQDLNVMIPNGVYIVWTDSDRSKITMTYSMQDVVCTKCNLAGELTSEPEFMRVQASLKMGHWCLYEGNGIGMEPVEGDYTISAM